MNRACVKCTSILDKSMVGDVEVDLCPSCGGLWLDSGELEKIGHGSPEDVAKLKNALVGAEAPEPPSDTTTPCVACDGKLKEMKLGDVTIEFCGNCNGIFLDKGELDQAIAAVGGMSVAQVLAAAGKMTGEFPAAT
jgi:Zn-finger nucleic acid-binding protein